MTLPIKDGTGTAQNLRSSTVSAEQVPHNIITDGDGHNLLIDAFSGAATVETDGHHRIHQGEMFRLCTTATLNSGENTNICFTTPNSTNIIHLVPVMEVTGTATWTLNEGATVTVDTGSALTPYNRNRNSSNTPTILSIETSPQTGKATLNATIAADGTTICTWLMGSGKLGGGNREEEEWDLKVNTTYVFRIVSGANGNNISLALNFYEAASLY